MTALGIDYAWVHPDPKAIKAAGYVFACRYLSRDPSKNLTRAEADALATQDVWVVANWEYGAQDMLRGYAGGIADAQLAQAQAVAAGMPSGRPIYFSADWDVTPTQESTVLAYLSGADSVLGHSRAGEYGGYYPIKIARDSGVAWTWQTSAWSGGQWDSRDTVRQTGSAVVGGVQVDVNEAMTADYGQWQPGRLPEPATSIVIPPHQERDMILHSITGSSEVWALSGSLYWHVVDTASLASYRAAGVPQATISAAEHAAILAGAEALKGQAATVVGPPWPKSFTVTTGA